MGYARRNKCAENTAERRDDRTLERRHDGVSRARDVAVAQFAEEAEPPPSPSAEKNADEVTCLGASF